MIDKKRITLVVPCRNEEKIIAAFIKKVPFYVDEILIVDNGSTDNTAEVAKSAGKRVRVIRETRTLKGIGYGFAHMRGLEEANGDYIVAMDGDDTYPLNAIKTVVRKMQREHWNFVSCNRLPLRNPKAISKTRQLGIKVLNWEIALLYGYPMKDILTGMWIVQKEIVHELKLKEGDWNLSPEIKLAALANPRIRFTEYHIDHFERAHEPSKQQIFKTGFAHLAYIAKRQMTQDNPLFQGWKSLWNEKVEKGKLVISSARYAFK